LIWSQEEYSLCQAKNLRVPGKKVFFMSWFSPCPWRKGFFFAKIAFGQYIIVRAKNKLILKSRFLESWL
jgi:hypothetical protein